MQLTRFDRWLLESFIQETHIFTLSTPEKVPRGIREIPMRDTPGRRFQHHYVSRSERRTNQFIASLRENGQMFSTQVSDRSTWYAPLIAPKGKSVTWRMVWIVITCVGVFYATMYFRSLWSSPQFQENLKDAREVLKN